MRQLGFISMYSSIIILHPKAMFCLYVEKTGDLDVKKPNFSVNAK
jgi:hypothetical protein